MKNLKTTFPAFACLLIVTILTATTFPTKTFSQTQTNFTNQVSKTDAPIDLKSTLNRFQQQRSINLLNNNLAETNNYDFAKQSQRTNDAATPKKSWMRKNWWVVPVLAGVGVGIYFLVKNSSSSGIRCNDGTISNAQNTQGACSYHGGIAR
jgi:predicted NACHT family NTPase